MDLEDLAAELRPRNGWQATDMGVRLFRHFLKPVYASYLLIIVPLVLIATVLCQIEPYLGVLILWFSKPLLERFPVYVLGNALFGNTPPPKRVINQAPKILAPRFLQSFFFDKFDLLRAPKTPVLVLENLQGKRRSRRLLHISRVSNDDATLWVSMLIVLLDWVLIIAALAVVIMFTPEPYASQLTADVDLIENDLKGMVFTIAYGLALCLTVPLNAAIGFAIYLNRRTQMEGWDIEINFRQIQRRTNKTGTFPALLLACLLGGALLLPGPVHANTQPNENAPAAIKERDEQCKKRHEHLERLKAGDTAEQQLADILAHDEFKICRIESRYSWELDQEDIDTKVSSSGGFGAGGLINSIMVVLAIGVAAYFLYLLLGQGKFQPKRKDADIPDTLFGLDVTPESLPDDVPQHAQMLWDNGEHRPALALLYRGALADLLHRYKTPLDSSLTEDEVLQRTVVTPAIPDLQAYLTSLTAAWQDIAYAHRQPTLSFAVLCREWGEHFQ